MDYRSTEQAGLLTELEAPTHSNGVFIGRLVRFDDQCRPWVTLDESHDQADAKVALTTWGGIATAVGKPVAVMLVAGDPERPLVIGPVMSSAAPATELLKDVALPILGEPALDREDATVVADGQSVRIHAADRIELRCGRASLILTNDGKVLLRGAYVSSRSSGVNRIKGGSVQIN